MPTHIASFCNTVASKFRSAEPAIMGFFERIPFVMIGVLICVPLACVVLVPVHEVGHALAGLLCGCPAKEIHIQKIFGFTSINWLGVQWVADVPNIIGGVTRFSVQPEAGWQAVFVAFAGPLAALLVPGACILALIKKSTRHIFFQVVLCGVAIVVTVETYFDFKPTKTITKNVEQTSDGYKIMESAKVIFSARS